MTRLGRIAAEHYDGGYEERELVSCPRCSGSGVLVAQDREGRFDVDCDGCNGTGEVEGDDDPQEAERTLAHEEPER